MTLLTAPIPAAISIAAPRTSRLQRVDVVRFICIVWVIWIHIAGSSELRPSLAFVRFRMPAFVILSVFFLLTTQQKHPGRGFAEYAGGRLKGLYVPFLAWAAIYYLIHSGYDYFTGGTWPAPSRGILLHGQAVHLWFVPFIVGVDLISYPLGRMLLKISAPPALLGTSLLVAGILLAAGVGPAFTDAFIDYEYPAHLKDLLWRGITLSPCILLGLAAFFYFKAVRRMPAPALGWLGVGGLAMVTAASLAGHFLGRHPLPESVAGLGIVLFALAPARYHWMARIARLGRHSFGMYLTHLLFVDVFHACRDAVHLGGEWWCDLAGLVACTLCTVLFTLALHRFSGTRWLVPSSPAAARPLGK